MQFFPLLDKLDFGGCDFLRIIATSCLISPAFSASKPRIDVLMAQIIASVSILIIATAYFNPFINNYVLALSIGSSEEMKKLWKSLFPNTIKGRF